MENCTRTPDYHTWWMDFNAHVNQKEQYRQFFIQNAQQLDLANVKTMVSIGPGCGDIDIFIIKHAMPKLQHYIGVEPNEANLRCLQKNLADHLPSIKVSLIHDKVQDWAGPGEEVDLVIAIQVFYWVPDPPVVLGQMYNWLRPGGRMVILLDKGDFIFGNIAAELGYPEDYYIAALKEDMLKAGLLDFEEGEVTCQFLDYNPSDDMLRAFFHYVPPGLYDQDCENAISIYKNRKKDKVRYANFHTGYVIKIKE